MRIFNLVECSDWDNIYGALVVNNGTVTSQEVQKKINEIKDNFFKLGIEDWGIEDVIEKMPYDWHAYFVDCCSVEI